MKILIARHGISEAMRFDLPDAERKLTKVGTNALKAQALRLKEEHLFPNSIFHSPKQRTLETAQIYQETLGGNLSPMQVLAHGCRLEDLLEVATSFSDEETVLFVGHQPDAGMMVYEWTGQSIRMQPGTVVLIEAPKSHLMQVIQVQPFQPSF